MTGKLFNIVFIPASRYKFSLWSNSLDVTSLGQAQYSQFECFLTQLCGVKKCIENHVRTSFLPASRYKFSLWSNSLDVTPINEKERK
jgi:hypothetical protein